MKKLFIFLLLICSFTNLQKAYAAVIKGKIAPANFHFPQNKSFRDDSTLLNKPAPKFELHDLNGKTCSLERLKGKVIVLNFWFVACKPCVNEMPVLNGIKNNYDPSKVVFLALSLDNKAAIDSFLKTHKFEYTILPDATPIMGKYDIYAYPASMVVDPQGIIRFVQVGGPNIGDNLSAAINAVLKNF